MKTTPFVIITAAYNEEKNVAKTIESVISQTFRPVEWILISDGSTDTTDAIIAPYAKKYSFIRFFRIERKAFFSFRAKVNAIALGLSKIKTRNYRYIGILDADISLGNTYYEKVIGHLEKNPRLGICGGTVIQYHNDRFERRLRSYNSVAGSLQFFRRECFEATGGFVPIEYGGEDAAIEVSARMNGWEVRTFPEIVAVHHGLAGKGAGGWLKSRFKNGKMYFALGYHPVFEFARCVLRIGVRPFMVGSIAELAGFFEAKRKHRRPLLPPKFVDYLRKEQMGRLKGMASFHRGVTIGY